MATELEKFLADFELEAHSGLKAAEQVGLRTKIVQQLRMVKMQTRRYVDLNGVNAQELSEIDIIDAE